MARILWFTSRTPKVLRASLDLRDGRLKNVTWRVVESILQSAAIYSVASISLAVTFFTSPTAAFPACHSVFPSVIGLVFLVIAMRISSSASAAASRHRSMLSTTGASALSLSSTLAGRLGEGSASHEHEHEHGKDAAEDDDGERGEHVHARSERERERGRTERHFRVASPIAIHVSVSTTRTSDCYESVDVHSPRTPPVETGLGRASLDICEAEEYGYELCDPEDGPMSTSEEWSEAL